MIILRTREAINTQLHRLQTYQSTIGLVPTMGALHDGHLELVRMAKESSDIVVVSIFVNPTQFNNSEDFKAYPKRLDKDLQLLDNLKVDFVFLPETEEIYPHLPQVRLHFGSLENVLEGAFRPGHFQGVGIVVSKLLNFVKPQKAFFGQKDLQQVAVIKALVHDLSFDVELIVIPTVRESDGLAMSSRNLRLSATQRKQATIIFKTLSKAKFELLQGREWLEVQIECISELSNLQEFRIEYLELVRPDTFQLMSGLEGQQAVSICIAAYLEDVRLIDNVSVID